MTLPEINQPLFQKIHDQIRFHPETHTQASWERTWKDTSGISTDMLAMSNTDQYYPDQYWENWLLVTDKERAGLEPSFCGTTRCVAGWAEFFETGKVTTIFKGAYVEGELHVAEFARRALGLTEDEADDLFMNMNNVQVAEMVERYALKGREI